MSKILGVAAALGAVMTLGAESSAQAAAVPTSVAKVKSAVAPTTSSVQYRRVVVGGGGWRGYGWRGYGWRYPYRYGWGWGWGWPYYGAAFATGAYVGAATAYPYYYPAPVYAPGPAYVAPPPVAGGPARQCWVETDTRGYGYYRPC